MATKAIDEQHIGHWYKFEWTNGDGTSYEPIPDRLLECVIAGVRQDVLPRWDYLLSPLLELQERRRKEANDQPNT